jgi:hypothetical protein
VGSQAGFGKSELKVVREQLSEAESLLSRYYCIPGREWPKYPYEVKTLTELKEPEIAENALAVVTMYEYSIQSAADCQRRLEVYGICLQDHNILAVSQRSPEEESFEALMLYILTHELVHVFRFANSPHSFFIEKRFRFPEENRVHRITRDILCRKRDPSLMRLLEAYQDYPPS